MKFLTTLCAVIAAYITGSCAHAAGCMAEIAIIDRDSGAQLETHYYRGEYWVAGEPGARYAIYLRNRLSERLLAVTSVDGVNVISGQTASWDQSGYVLDPRQDYQINGWRKSDYEVAAFAFTAPPDSYAARTGRPQNIGVIGVAVFRERAASYAPPPFLALSPRQSSSAQRSSSDGTPAAAPLAGLAAKSESSMQSAAVPSPALGTAHGERESSYATRTDFIRMQSQPNEIIRIHYDSLDNLIAMGIIRQPRHYPSTRPDPFPGSEEQHYVPDPQPS